MLRGTKKAEPYDRSGFTVRICAEDRFDRFRLLLKCCGTLNSSLRDRPSGAKTGSTGLTGCSVFVYGDPRQPTISHVGTRTDTPYGDDCALFWRELLHLERVQRQRDKGSASEVNVDQYIGETLSIYNFRSWLKRRPETFTIKSICAYGTVFGIRYGSLWSFYLQECGFVDVYKVVQQKRRRLETVSPDFSLPEPMWYTDKLVEFCETVTVEKEYSKTIPFSVRPFFPKGGGSAKLRWAFTSQEGYFQ
jgi:hypothetical protein